MRRGEDQVSLETWSAMTYRMIVKEASLTYKRPVDMMWDDGEPPQLVLFNQWSRRTELIQQLKPIEATLGGVAMGWWMVMDGNGEVTCVGCHMYHGKIHFFSCVYFLVMLGSSKKRLDFSISLISINLIHPALTEFGQTRRRQAYERPKTMPCETKSFALRSFPLGRWGWWWIAMACERKKKLQGV